MKESKLKKLMDYQKFEHNAAMDFAIKSARSYISSLSKSAYMEELSDSDLDMLNAAGPSGGNIKNMYPLGT